MKERKNKYPILAKGEYYIEPISKKYYSGEKIYPNEYYENKRKLKNNIIEIEKKIKLDNSSFVEQKVLCIRLEPKFEAKSYLPSSLLVDSNMEFIGGRKYKINENHDTAKLYFIKSNDKDIIKLKERLDSNYGDNIDKWKHTICSINSIDLLHGNEKIMGFENDWAKGKVEIVLHPLHESLTQMIDGLLGKIKKTESDVSIRTYENGLTFVCTYLNREELKLLEDYNPLRSVKPISDFSLDIVRNKAFSIDAPKLPSKLEKSHIKIGVFDGGVSTQTALLKNYVKNYDISLMPASEKSLEHGTGVCGAVLFGPLNGKDGKSILENPMVSIESFRVLPAERTGDEEKDFEMYKTIDCIEEIVKKRTDLKVYNLSFGPRTPIIDDDLNRFTYALDLLTYNVAKEEVNPLFCVAAGNDGDKMSPLDRIQPPSDMVNGLSVGAYTYSNAVKSRSTYSCIGPGREGAKIKPDILEFGGDHSTPFVKLLPEDKITIDMGTSYATPVVTGKIGCIMAKSDNITPHLARTLLIHNAEKPEGGDNRELGFGYLPENVDDCLECDDKRVTILYEGELTSSTHVKLPVFLPDMTNAKGNFKIDWTICTIVNPNINDSDAYTNNCIEDYFYPNSMKYKFIKSGVKKTYTINLLEPDSIKKVEEVVNLGFHQSDLPVSEAANYYVSENELRNKEYKWDTVIKKGTRKRATSLFSPYLILHALGRDDCTNEKIKYFVCITVSCDKYNGSIYDSIVQNYTHLNPITIKNKNRIMVAIEKDEV